MHAGGDLEEDADELDLVADGFEEELFEGFARLEPVLGVEMPHGFLPARVLFELHLVYFARPVIRGLVTIILLALNLALWGIPLTAFGLVKLLTFGAARRRAIRVLSSLAERWVGGNDRIMDLMLTTEWDIDGPGETTYDGRYLIISNHVSWVDIFVLFRAFHGKTPFMRFFLKRELIWFPIAGQACWALEFPFMRRYSPEYLAKHPEKRGRDLETTRIAMRRYRDIPVSILNFCEGTRFTEEKQEDQQSPYRYLLRPRAGGISFVLASLGDQLDGMFDVTIIYPTPEVLFFDFVANRIPKITVRVRRLDVPPEFCTKAILEPTETRGRFKRWIAQVWREKDELIARLSGAGPGVSESSSLRENR